MIKKVVSLVVTFALICSLAISALATPSDVEPKVTATNTSSPASNLAAKRNEKLSADMRKLVADARAGSIAPAPRPQIQPAASNSFSTRAKVAIGVGAAVVVIALIVNHERKHFFD
jgi:hypothetical protein